jgi:hypothetical protein
MKNTLKKGVLVLVLAVLAVGGVFAQKVGDTVQLSGQPYTIQSVSGDTVTLRKVVSIDGVWEHSNGSTFVINGSTCTCTWTTQTINSFNSTWKGAYNNKTIYDGIQNIRNITKTGERTWTGEAITLRNASTIVWAKCNLVLSPDGRTLSFSGSLSGDFTRK